MSWRFIGHSIFVKRNLFLVLVTKITTDRRDAASALRNDVRVNSETAGALCGEYPTCAREGENSEGSTKEKLPDSFELCSTWPSIAAALFSGR
jgi:hypothetical protein